MISPAKPAWNGATSITSSVSTPRILATVERYSSVFCALPATNRSRTSVDQVGRKILIDVELP